MGSEPKRAYDAGPRRERAEAERLATRRRVIAAARRLFIRSGYTATTMTEIAAEAGVALQSVYKAGTNKAELLHMVVDLEVAGDDDEVMVSDRASFQAIGNQADPRRQVHMIADLIAATQERSASIQVAFRQAAAVDESVAALLDVALQRRLETFTVVIGMIPRGRLSQPLDESTESAWAIGSSEVFLLLRNVRGWDADHYRKWLRRTLVGVLLKPPSTV
jgi:TetR/AcrR family transcriptional regulator, regulator of autoinduction and epiphytic fitness